MTRAVARWMLGKAKAELRVRRKDHKETCRVWRIYTARNRALLTLNRDPIWYQEDECWREMGDATQGATSVA